MCRCCGTSLRSIQTLKGIGIFPSTQRATVIDGMQKKTQEKHTHRVTHASIEKHQRFIYSSIAAVSVSQELKAFVRAVEESQRDRWRNSEDLKITKTASTTHSVAQVSFVVVVGRNSWQTETLDQMVWKVVKLLNTFFILLFLQALSGRDPVKCLACSHGGRKAERMLLWNCFLFSKLSKFLRVTAFWQISVGHRESFLTVSSRSFHRWISMKRKRRDLSYKHNPRWFHFATWPTTLTQSRILNKKWTLISRTADNQHVLFSEEYSNRCRESAPSEEVWTS